MKHLLQILQSKMIILQYKMFILRVVHRQNTVLDAIEVASYLNCNINFLYLFMFENI